MSIEDRISALEGKTGSLEGQVKTLASTQMQLVRDIQSNTDLTKAIQANTEDLIALLKGGKVFGKVTAWVLGICAAVVGVWASVKGLR